MLDSTILGGLVHDEHYMRKVIPFVKRDYFSSLEVMHVFDMIKDYIDKYNAVPNKQVLTITLDSDESLNEEKYRRVKELIEGLNHDQTTDLQWLVDKTEEFCQDRAIYNAIRESILVIDGKHATLDKGSLPQLLSDALAVSFDTNIGHDFIEDADTRYDKYHTAESKIPFDLDIFNQITKGGVSRKALIVALAGTGVGKTLFMAHCAAAAMMRGLKVLYITLEMAEEKIAERIDANLLDITIDELMELPKDVYKKRIARIRERTAGKLIIKEYPTASAGAGHFRHLLNELRLKKKFKPDIIFVDYINLCVSSRMKYGANMNSYTYIKSIAEELRGLGVEQNVPIFTATQTTRSGFSNTDVGLEDTSESFGLPATTDFMFALISTEELEALGQLMVKQLKNRWGDVNFHKRFLIGVDRSKMKLFDLEDPHEGLVEEPKAKAPRNEDRPVMDTGAFAWDDETPAPSKPDFKGFR